MKHGQNTAAAAATGSPQPRLSPRVNSHRAGARCKACGFLPRLIGDDGGATALEYALIAGFVVLAIVVAVTTLGGNLLGMYQTIVAGI